MITEYHAKLFAHELSRLHSVADAAKLAGTLLDAQVTREFMRDYVPEYKDAAEERGSSQRLQAKGPAAGVEIWPERKKA